MQRKGVGWSQVAGRFLQALGDILGPLMPSPAGPGSRAASFGDHCVPVYYPARLHFWAS